MTTGSSFIVPSFIAVADPAKGHYQSCEGTLRGEIDAIIAAIAAGSRSRHPVPGMPGFYCSGRMIGSSVRLTIAKQEDAAGEALNPIEICTTFAALDSEDVEALVAEALGAAREQFGEEINPSFGFAMRDMPEAPFTAVVSHHAIDDACARGLLAFHELERCTGFFQTIIGCLLERSGLFDDGRGVLREVFLDDDVAYYTLDTRDIAGAIQTGGAMLDTVIVEPGEGGYPRVYAYMADAEMDVFRIDFSVDEMTLDTEDMRYLMLDPEMLDTLRDLRSDADIIWEEMDPVLFALEELREDADELGIDFVDPLEEHYTNWPKIEVSPNLAARMTRMLGLSTRYADARTSERGAIEDARL